MLDIADSGQVDGTGWYTLYLKSAAEVKASRCRIPDTFVFDLSFLGLILRFCS